MGGHQSVAEKSIHDFVVKDYRGKDVKLSDYKQKVLLIFQRYELHSTLNDKYKDKGFKSLVFPCNQFLRQEPWSSDGNRLIRR